MIIFIINMGFLKKDKIKMIQSFITFVSNELSLNTIPSICIQNNRKGIKTTANYDYSKKKKVIKVYGKNRSTVDILRSVAHEMVHHKQWEDGRLKEKPQDIGGDIEGEANSKAGEYIKMFAKDTPELYTE